MDFLIFISFVLATIVPLYTARKFLNHRDVSVFDVNIMAVYLYLILIPVYYYVKGNKDAIEILNGPHGTEALFVATSFLFLLMLVDVINTSRNKFKTSLLNLSYQCRKFYDNFNSFQKLHAILLVVYVLLNLSSVLFIGNKNGDDLTDNNQEHLYLKTSTWQESLDEKLKTVYSVFLTTTLICSICIIKKTKTARIKTASKFIIVAILISYMFVSRTLLTNTIIFILIFLYSINRKKIKLLTYARIFVLFGFLFTVFFPLFQVFRFAKQIILTYDVNANIIDIFKESINNIEKLDAFTEAAAQSSGRSLGLFWSLVQSLGHPNYYGWCFYKSIFNLLPGKESLDSNVEFQLAVAYDGYGTDICDSVLMYSIADFGYLGVIFCFVYYFIFIKIYKYQETLLRKYNYNGLFTFTYVYSLFVFMFLLENSPYWSFRGLFYYTLLGCFINGVILKFLSKKSKKIYI